MKLVLMDSLNSLTVLEDGYSVSLYVVTDDVAELVRDGQLPDPVKAIFDSGQAVVQVSVDDDCQCEIEARCHLCGDPVSYCIGHGEETCACICNEGCLCGDCGFEDDNPTPPHTTVYVDDTLHADVSVNGNPL